MVSLRVVTLATGLCRTPTSIASQKKNPAPPSSQLGNHLFSEELDHFELLVLGHAPHVEVD